MDRLRAILLTLAVAGLALLYRAQDARLALGQVAPVTQVADAEPAIEAVATPPASVTNTGTNAGTSQEELQARARRQHRRVPHSAEDYYLQVLARVSRGPGVARFAPNTRLNQDYADLFKHLQLDPGTAKALVDLLLRRQQARWWMYSRLHGWDGKLSIHDAMLKAAEERRRIEAEMRALLGDEAYDIYEQYVETLPLRRDLAGFKTKLFGAGIDLSWEQEDALLRIMQAEARRPISAEEDPVLSEVASLLPEERNVPESEIYLRRLELFNERFLAAAEDILTPEQLKLYEEHLYESMNQDEHYVGQAAPWDVASNDRAPVTVGQAGMVMPAPVDIPAASSANSTWGDYHGGSQAKVYPTETGLLTMETDLGTGWGAGVTFWPGSSSPNPDGSVNAAGATRVVARINAPAGATLRFGVLESGAQWSGAPTFTGENGADGEAFRHEGVTTEAGWQVYSIPLSDLKLNGGFGNQSGNRTIDTQALKGLEILVPGGQQDIVMEIDYLRVE